MQVGRAQAPANSARGGRECDAIADELASGSHMDLCLDLQVLKLHVGAMADAQEVGGLTCTLVTDARAPRTGKVEVGDVRWLGSGGLDGYGPSCDTRTR